MNSALLQGIKQRYGIVGNYGGLNRALEVALKIAPVDLSVLITGENGTGKEVFPRLIHDNSIRKNKKYFAVNCGAIPEGTIDSELFGHEKGSFTGAVERREGYFTVANGGTLFLDEVGELPLSTQARLLRVLETGEYIPVGASEVKKSNVRIVAATNVNMERAIEEGKFREDLYYRLNTVSISIPPLRERGDDVLLLFRKFALEMSEKYKMPPVRLNDAAQQMLLAYSWPGNVRQLKNIAENMSVTSEERDITPEVLRTYLPEERNHRQVVALKHDSGNHSFENEREILYQILFDLRRDVTELKKIVANDPNYKVRSAESATSSHEIPFYRTKYPVDGCVGRNVGDDEEEFMPVEEIKELEDSNQKGNSLENVEIDTIKRALERTGGNRRQAASILGISERTLYRKIKEYGLE